MSALRFICRLIIGAVFLYAGFTKLIDPVATSLIIDDYLTIFHLTFLKPIAMIIGMVLSSTEYIVGVCLLCRLNVKVISILLLAMVSFFTLITLYLVIFNPMADCGCFGHALYLTTTETFIKNILLLAGSLFLFFQRKRVKTIAPAWLEWSFTVIFGIVAAAITINAYYYIPAIEFDYKIGTDLRSEDANINLSQVFHTVLIYEKDGEQKEFQLNNLPDESWTFVDSYTIEPEKSETELMLFDKAWNEVTPEIVSHHKYVLLSIYNPEKIEDWSRINSFGNAVLASGSNFAIVIPDENQAVEMQHQFTQLYADKTSLMKMNRSNGGATFLAEGIIAQKWSFIEIVETEGLADILNSDGEVLTIRTSIHKRLYTIGTVALTLIALLLINTICRISFKSITPIKLLQRKKEEAEKEEAVQK
ncbi:MAG: DoxX family protein [Bacteroidales bacterium]|nr:DoxX family protein [Bacteroidales bacterium]